MTKLFSLFVISFSFLLTACGGGAGSDSGSGGNANTGSEITYVAGEIKYSAVHEDNVTAPKPDSAYGSSGVSCSNSSYYFESENVVVFGGEGYPDTDMKYAATLVEHNLDTAFSKMSITKEEFSLARPYYITKIAEKIIDLMAYGWSADGNDYDITSLTLHYPFNSTGWSEAPELKRVALVNAYWNSLDNSGQYLLGKEFDKVSDFKIPELNVGVGDYKMPLKVMVCLSDRQNESQYGEGTLLGMNLAYRSVHKRSNNDESQVVLHELIHTIQQNLSSPVKTISHTLDHWFIEGQATFLAGQNKASSKDGMRPVDVVTWYDEGQVFGGSTSDAYKHYALAYSLIDDKEAIKGLLYDVRNHKGYGLETSPSNGVSGTSFESAFDANISTTLQNFRTNYDSF
ncbi:MAG: hypothetical protein AXW17_03305 [Colwellia sp. Phe_37]|nr:MAG: hypothetical protein AXW17_03305 [Colwellia sp. Phe_37]